MGAGRRSVKDKDELDDYLQSGWGSQGDSSDWAVSSSLLMSDTLQGWLFYTLDLSQ